MKRTKTETSRFGSSKREGHDSSLFYSSKLYAGAKVKEQKCVEENPVPSELLDQVVCGDSRRVDELPGNSVHLVVTSPPYNVSKEYDTNLSLEEYLTLLREVMVEVHRVLVRGGRVCLNIANVGRKPYIPLTSYVNILMAEVGFLQRGEIIWNKAASAGSSTAWGSWQSASNPTLRDVHEYILVYSKGQFRHVKEGREDTISRDDFLELTKSVWSFPTESAKRVGHPAPFPVELPRRCIELYSFLNEVVYDPFVGSGSTCMAAKTLGRHYVGVDISEEYVQLAQDRLKQS